MNQTGKPKHVKLWKNSGSADRKPKSPMTKAKEDVPGGFKAKRDSFKKQGKGNTNFKSKKGKFYAPNNPTPNLKRKNQSQDYIPNKKIRPVTYETDNAIKTKQAKSEEGAEPKEFAKKKVDKVQSNVASKKTKPDNMTRKDWKILHLDKKAKTADDTDTPQPDTKLNWKEIHMKEKGKTKIFEVGKILKQHWEELRREDCAPERKSQLLKQVCDNLKGRVKEFTFAHDTVRVLECVLAQGAETHRNLLFNELKGEFLNLVKSKYGKFFLMKMLRYGTKQHKDEILKSFHGKVISLIKHTQAAEVLEMAFNECANATQRFELIQEFFGANYKFFKVTNVHSLQQLIEANPEKKASIIENMKTALLKVLNKAVVKHSIVHNVLWNFMKHCDADSRPEIIESLREHVPEILHTKDGSRAAMHCVWYGSIKDRKVIVKSMRRFVTKIAKEEHGHMVLLALFDALDDTKLIEKHIIQELVKNALEISQNIHGKRVLVYLLSPRDSHFFHPDVIRILQVGDNNGISKKDPELRQSELKSVISQPLLQLVGSNIQNLYTDSAFCYFVHTILECAVGDRKEVFESIADILVEPYTTENRNVHAIEHKGSTYLLKMLIIRDQNTPEDDCYFSDALISRIPKCVMSSWIECNRGAFLLVSLIETNRPAVIERIKKELEGRKNYLAKKNYKGAEILLKKLKDV